jgi:hypothetical protein
MRQEVFNLDLFIEGKPVFKCDKEMVLRRRLKKRERLIYDVDNEKTRLIYLRQVGSLIFIWTKFFYKEELDKGIEELRDSVKLTVKFILEGKEEKFKKLSVYTYKDFLIFSNAKLEFKKIKKPRGILAEFELL